jgi:chaperonin GroES
MSKLKIKPLADRVIVLPDAIKDKTEKGIIIPESAKEKPLRGTVMAVGKGHPDYPINIKKGDTVLYSKQAGTELELDGETYLMMKENDIYAII